MAPLCMTAAEFAAAGIKGHSLHGTPADLVRFMGAARGFGGADARIAGHWLRDKEAIDVPVRPNGAAARAPGAANQRGDMERR